MSSELHSPHMAPCPRPFEWFELHRGGEVFLCCPAWRPRAVGNLLQQSAASIWNGRLAQEARQGMLSRSFHGCSRRRCPFLASGAQPNLRNPEAGSRPGEAIEARLTTLPYGPRVLNLCFDGSCNLACPSCRPAPFVSTGESRSRAEKLAERIAGELAAEAEEIILSGYGDPFGSPVYRRLLQGIRPADWPRLSRIHLHTNGQLWDCAAWDALAPIHPYVRSAEISIDAATAGTYAENRGGDFGRLLENLHFLRTLSLDVTLSFVVQQNNFREMPAFAELGRRLGFRVYFGRLVNWGTFTRQEYRKRGVHLPEHPEHDAFAAILGHLSEEPGVDLGNLAPLALRIEA